MKIFLLLFLSQTTGCEALSEVKGCASGWVEFTCKYPKPNVKYQSIYVVSPKEIIRSSEKDVWENKGRVSLYHDPKNTNLRVAIKQLEREDFGDYQCKFHQRSDSSQDTEEVKLDVETDGCQGQFIQTAYRTAKTTITCDHTGNKYKFFCKQNGSICEDILSTKSSLKSNGTFTLTETNSSFSMSISNVSSHDAGVYRCGVETHEGSYRASLRKIQLKVEGGPHVVITVIVCVAVLLLLFVLILILIYACKSYYQFAEETLTFCKQKTTLTTAPPCVEDHVYEEIQQTPNSGNKMNSIYATANFPTNPSASQHYSSINFQTALTELVVRQ
ncbi:polymeric immunoglobulin receptor-like [Micropterus salmoides]|uniref:polymeric immunoglobulin receptor-like n=1 Tax=Micropterus salmoides TaxID=27706 RepID=UPI0018EB60FA|nr:polymeric immunoglobulin receptor-like [Micropterus salmoides]